MTKQTSLLRELGYLIRWCLFIALFSILTGIGGYYYGKKVERASWEIRTAQHATEVQKQLEQVRRTNDQHNASINQAIEDSKGETDENETIADSIGAFFNSLCESRGMYCAR